VCTCVRGWRFAGRGGVAFALEGCAGWRYAAEELAAAGIAAQLAEPAGTAAARGRKRHATTGKSDSRHLRELLAEGRLPECWVPPSRILDCRALLETYHDLRAERAAWVQRVHAVFFGQGAPALADGGLRAGRCDLEALRAAAACCLSPAGQLQVGTALEVLAGLEARLQELRRELLDAARRLAGAGVLAARLCGVGPVTALAMTCWLGGAGRFSSSRKAVRFAGLGITVYSFDSKRSPGRLSRQGPPALRWAVYEAGEVPAAPPPTAPTTRRSRTAGTASAPPCRRPASSSARPAASWPSSAATRSAPPEPGIPGPRSGHRDAAGRAGEPEPNFTRWGTTAASSRQSAVSRYRPCRAAPGGRPASTERPHPPQAGGRPINHHVTGRCRRPRA
jgi:transposase